MEDIMTEKILREDKAQRYRAVAKFTDGSEGLICLGGTMNMVRESYSEAFLWLYNSGDDRRPIAHTEKIMLERWNGGPDCGHWSLQALLAFPQAKPVAV